MDTEIDTRCVIRVTDKCGSYFCGFQKDKIRLSRAKKNAKVYVYEDGKNPHMLEDIKKIIMLSEYTLLTNVQLYTAAPDIV